VTLRITWFFMSEMYRFPAFIHRYAGGIVQFGRVGLPAVTGVAGVPVPATVEMAPFEIIRTRWLTESAT